MTTNMCRAALAVGLFAAGLFPAACGGSSDSAAAEQASPAKGDSDSAKPVVPVNERYRNYTYPEWAVQWWQWQLHLPKAGNPIVDTADCSAGNSGDVWFIAGACVTETVTRNCKIPANTALYVVINPTVCSTYPPDNASAADPTLSFPITGAGMRACVDQTWPFSEVAAELDGVPVQNIRDFNIQTPFFGFEVPDGLVTHFGEPPGVYAAIAENVAIMLKPLRRGEHTLHFRTSESKARKPDGTVVDIPADSYAPDITYHLTVE